MLSNYFGGDLGEQRVGNLSMNDDVFIPRSRARDHYVKMKNLIPVTVDEKAFVERHHPDVIYDFQLSMP